MGAILEERLETREKQLFVEDRNFSEMLDSARRRGKLGNLSALVVDATETSRWDVFKFLQKHVLHLGAVSVASLLNGAGFKETRAVYEVLTPDYDYSKLNPDLIGVSAIVTNVPFANKRLEFFRRTKPESLLLAGGAGYAFNPEIAVEHGADAVVVGKAEHALLELLAKLSESRMAGESLRDSFLRLNGGGIQGIYESTNRRRGFAPIVRGMNVIPRINYNLIEGEQSRKMRSLEDSGGCIHRCDFCSSRLLNGGKYRAASIERIVEEMREAKRDGIKSVFFIGDHAFARGYEDLDRLTRAIENADLGMSWVAQATVKSLYDNLNRGIMERLEKSRCSMLCLGMESTDDESLKEINASGKNSREQSERVLGVLKESPIEVHAMLVLPPFVEPEKKALLPFSVEDSEKGRKVYAENVRDMVDFLQRYDVRNAQFLLATPLPGTKSTRSFFDAGIVLDTVGGKRVEWNKYNGQYVVASSNPLESHKRMVDAYKRFYSGDYIFKPCHAGKSRKNKLGQMFFRALGKGIVFAHLHTKECKNYVNALERGDFSYCGSGRQL